MRSHKQLRFSTPYKVPLSTYTSKILDNQAKKNTIQKNHTSSNYKTYHSVSSHNAKKKKKKKTQNKKKKKKKKKEKKKNKKKKKEK